MKESFAFALKRLVKGQTGLDFEGDVFMIMIRRRACMLHDDGKQQGNIMGIANMCE